MPRVAALAALLLVPLSAGADAERHPRTIYFTTGDHQDLLGLPLDSKATIEATFETIRQRYHVTRVWWRGGQDEVWGKEFLLRKENRMFARIWQWWKDLAYEKVGTNRIAVRAARDRGMQIWMAYGLFDNGSQADAGYVGFPYAIEDRLRVKHPEWAPLNRFGTWRQGGPIEFAYPGARKGMVEYLTRHVVEGGYDGIAFLTYAENFSQRYEDEFGFNQPIVDEFKKRHGVDIRTQPFDKQAWSKLRGEYLTQFLRELRAALSRHGKKIAVCVDGKNPHLPTNWNIDGGVRTAGTIHFDLATWAKEHLVDEVNVYAPSSDEAVAACLKATKGTRAHTSVFRTRGKLPDGTPRIMFVGQEIESGFDWENFIDWPDEKLTPQAAEALKTGDAYARRRLLLAVARKKQKIPLADIAAAAQDKDVFVRRAALRALAILGDASAKPAVERALLDSENSVRWQAALVLGQLSGPASVTKILEAAARHDSTFQFNFRAVPEVLKNLSRNAGKGKTLGPAEKALIAKLIASPDARMREMALYCFKLVGAPATPEMEKTLLRVIRDDPSPFAKELAMTNLRSSFGATPRVIAAILAAMQDADTAVQVRAVTTLAEAMSPKGLPRAERDKAIGHITDFFRLYGDGKRPDADWGWREVGNALLLFGNDGRAVLENLMAAEPNRSPRLADLAWRVLYLRQGDRFYPITEKEDRQAHAKRP